ncbi:glucose 1-dehydrogenase [Asticcacaulis machinosus]|uniref:Glucose 1-dehydrogenase n=1 Tax=Asticcacaulis machinosus TaxID=2984211 RepID=A0ABT5HM12_9CAUL|nr:glucose 1-dehydrogenase [Asticcacaulis machinosus]MDC7677286.1 glucose 1-dehydrogenase [Asticcacaulis machinosus]
MTRLANKIALVTGGASGIGEAIVRAFVAEGATVIISDIDPKDGEALAAELGDQASYMHLDVALESEWINVTDIIAAKFGALNILVNNAGITGNEGGGGRPHDPEHTALEDWRKVMHVNLDGTFLGCKHAIRVMRETGSDGSIINMSSRSGLVGIPHQAAYAASKAAVRNHSKTVALYCAEQNLNIRCNSVHPAAIQTPMWDEITKKGNPDKMKAATPLHRFGRPEEVAALVLLLASDEATYITGSEFNIDGGILAGSSASPE